MKTLKEEREAIVDKLSTICKQADQYQINAGYPVETPAIKIVEALLLSHEEKVRDERDTYWKERVRKEVEGMKRKITFNGSDESGFIQYGQVIDSDCEYNQALDTLLDNLK